MCAVCVRVKVLHLFFSERFMEARQQLARKGWRRGEGGLNRPREREREGTQLVRWKETNLFGIAQLDTKQFNSFPLHVKVTTSFPPQSFPPPSFSRADSLWAKKNFFTRASPGVFKRILHSARVAATPVRGDVFVREFA